MLWCTKAHITDGTSLGHTRTTFDTLTLVIAPPGSKPSLKAFCTFTSMITAKQDDGTGKDEENYDGNDGGKTSHANASEQRV